MATFNDHYFLLVITIIISDDHNMHSILLSEDHFFVEHEIHSTQYCTAFTEKICNHTATYTLTSMLLHSFVLSHV